MGVFALPILVLLAQAELPAPVPAENPAPSTTSTPAAAPVKDRPFIAFHDAYGYFTAHYGLTMAGTVSAGDAAAPGARHLADEEVP